MFRATATTLAGVPTGRDIAAGGEDIDTATQIESDIAIVTDGTGGVKLQSAVGGTGCMVANKTDAAVNVYPADYLGRMNDGPLGEPVAVASLTASFFFCFEDGNVVVFAQGLKVTGKPTQEEIDAAKAAAEARAEARRLAEEAANQPAEPAPEPVAA